MKKERRKDIGFMRDCVKEAFHKGCERGLEFHKMRHAIILELKRLGYSSTEIKDMLLEWNKKCEKPLNLSEQRIQLLKYVDWVDSRECKISCVALEDYCIGKEECLFYIRTSSQNRQKTGKLPFKLQELEEFLTERFEADGHVMMLIVQALRFIQREKTTGEIIFVGFRGITSKIRDKFGYDLYHMDIFRKMKLLIEEGIIGQVVKGKSGNFRRQANGYRFLPWQHPKVTQVHIPILTHMCNKIS